MSKEDIETVVSTVVDIVTKPHQKTENRKILVMFLIGLPPTILLGIYLNKWDNFKNSQEEFKIEATKKLDQHSISITRLEEEKNEREMQYINHLKIK